VRGDGDMERQSGHKDTGHKDSGEFVTKSSDESAVTNVQ
jgi:hypothetical protein